MVVLDTAYYGMPMYSGVWDPLFWPFSDEVPGGGLGRLFCKLSMLLGFIRLSGIERVVSGSCYPAGYAEAVIHRTECIIRDSAPHPRNR